LILSGLITAGTFLIASDSANMINIKRPWEMDIMTTGYKFVWQFQERPDFKNYNPKKKLKKKKKKQTPNNLHMATPSGYIS
jgi:hypothetical protein